MKLPTSDRSSFTVGDASGNEMQFGIANVDALLEVVRKNMYSNPIESICREISCNARDAHYEVNTPERRIEISLPTVLNPQIEIKDFGPGITPDRMENIFLRFAASTKRDDNTQTGGFGLGAKTPFAYTDSFTIITTTGGVRRVYTCYINTDDKLLCQPTSEESTEEPNGTTIVVPVKKKDFDAFARGVISSTKFWAVKPIVHGLVDDEAYPKEGDIAFSGSNWSVRSVSEDYYRRNDQAGMRVIIDGTGYDINPESLGFDRHSRDKFDGFVYRISSRDFRMEFGVGELTISSSREALRFSDETKELLHARLKEVHASIVAAIQTKVDKIDSLTVAESLYESDFTAFLKDGDKILWNGIKLTGTERWRGLNNEDDTNKNKSKLDEVTITRLLKKKAYGWNKNHLILSSEKVNRFNIDAKVIISETTRMPRTRIKEYLSQDKAITVIHFHNDEAEKFWTKRWNLGHVETMTFDDLPELPKKERAPRKKRDKVVSNGWIYNTAFDGHFGSSHWEPEEDVDLGEGVGVYVIIEDVRQNKISAGIFGDCANSTLTDIDNFLEDPLYAIHRRDVGKLGDGWETVDSIIDDIQSELDDFDQKAYESAEEALSNEEYELRGLMSSDIKSGEFSSESTMGSYLAKRESIVKVITDGKKLNNLWDSFGHAIFKGDKAPHSSSNIFANNVLEKLGNKFLAAYPLIRHISSYTLRNAGEEILEYINLIDEANAKKKAAAKAA